MTIPIVQERSRTIQYRNVLKSLNNNKSIRQGSEDTLKASKIRAILNSYVFTESYKQKNKVVFNGEQFPNELLYAMGVIPFNLETMAALFSQADNIQEYFKLADEFYFSRDICSIIRSSIGIALANCLPTPDAAFANSHPCDGEIKNAKIMSQFYDAKLFAIDTPTTLNQYSIDYLANQLKQLVQDLELEFGLSLDHELLQQTISYSNSARDYFCDTATLLKTSRLPLVARELLEIVISNPWGLKELVTAVRTLYNEALQRKQNEGSQKERKRVIWIGQLPFFSNRIIEYLESYVDLMFFAALDEANWLSIDPEAPFDSMAKRLINFTWDPFRISKSLVNVCSEYKIDGAIILNVWGCRNYTCINPILRETGVDNSFKLLTIDADIMDSEKMSFAHIKNRIDAFLEIL